MRAIDSAAGVRGQHRLGRARARRAGGTPRASAPGPRGSPRPRGRRRPVRSRLRPRRAAPAPPSRVGSRRAAPSRPAREEAGDRARAPARPAPGIGSWTSTSIPASAATCAMPAPIVPAPSTPIATRPAAASSALEARLALLGERRDALGVVLGPPGQSCSAASAARLRRASPSSAALISRLASPMARVGPRPASRRDSPRRCRARRPGNIPRRGPRRAPRRRPAARRGRASAAPRGAARAADQGSGRPESGTSPMRTKAGMKGASLGGVPRDRRPGRGYAAPGGDAVDGRHAPASPARGWRGSAGCTRRSAPGGSPAPPPPPRRSAPAQNARPAPVRITRPHRIVARGALEAASSSRAHGGVQRVERPRAG